MKKLQHPRRASTAVPVTAPGRTLAPGALAEVKGGLASGDPAVGEARNSGIDDWQTMQS
jgi:hypothetical protein